MAVEHSDILSADCHEPKHITNASTGDAGKVITPSASVSGSSVLRQLSISDLSDFPASTVAFAQSSGTGLVIALTNGSYTKINGSYSQDEADGASVASGDVVVATDGVYRVSASLSAQFAAAAQNMDYTLALNGTPSAANMSIETGASGDNHNVVVANDLISLVDGDAVSIVARPETDSANLTINYGSLNIELIKAA